jgi:Ca2+-binding EF-hand superfamily protein
MKQIPANSELWAAKSQGNIGDHLESFQLSDVEQAQIKEIFDLFDTDGGGSIDCREKDAAMYALGFQPLSGSNPAVPGRQMQQIGSQGASYASREHDSSEPTEQVSQTITLHEFTNLMKGEHVIRNPVDAIWAAFAELSGTDILNSSSDGVTVEGLKRACDKYDVKLSEGELNQLINELDVDGDGSVDKEEYMRLMRLTPWF